MLSLLTLLSLLCERERGHFQVGAAPPRQRQQHVRPAGVTERERRRDSCRCVRQDALGPSPSSMSQVAPRWGLSVFHPNLNLLSVHHMALQPCQDASCLRKALSASRV
eukprot:5701424-Pleurochrysis_carterae.AAC.1